MSDVCQKCSGPNFPIVCVVKNQCWFNICTFDVISNAATKAVKAKSIKLSFNELLQTTLWKGRVKISAVAVLKKICKTTHSSKLLDDCRDCKGIVVKNNKKSNFLEVAKNNLIYIGYKHKCSFISLMFFFALIVCMKSRNMKRESKVFVWPSPILSLPPQLF